MNRDLVGSRPRRDPDRARLARGVVVLGLCLFLSAVFTGSRPVASQTTMSQDPRRGIVKILVQKGSQREDVGVGMVVGSDATILLILTAAHVIDDAESIQIIFFDKPYLKFDGRPHDKRNDDLDIGLVIVDLGRRPEMLESLPDFSVGKSTTLRPGDTVAAIGHPLDQEWQTAPNSVVSLSERDDSRKLTFTHTGLAPGNSGGALMDERGALVGMVLKKAPLHAVAVRVESLQEVLANWRIPMNYLDGQDGGAILEVVSLPPGAEVFLDDRNVGGTSPGPLVVRAVQPGKHSLRIVKPGFSTWLRELDVREGETKEILATLDEKEEPGGDTQTALEPSPEDPDGDVVEVITVPMGEDPGSGPSTQAPTQTPTQAPPETAAEGATGPVFNPGSAHPFNYLPQPHSDGAVTQEDTPLTIDVLANDTDPDGDRLTILEVERDSKEHGSVATDGSTVTYIPAKDFHGGDTFRYTVTDGKEGLATSTVTVAVTSVNDRPNLEVSDLTVKEGERLEHSLEAVDPDGGTLTFAAAGLPPGADLEADTALFTFTPAFDLSSAENEKTFDVQFTVTDEEGGSASGTARITVEDTVGGLDPGVDLSVALTDPVGGSSATLTFDTITAPGVVTISSRRSSPKPPPTGYRVSGNRYLDIASSARHTGAVEICLEHGDLEVDQAALSLFRLVPEGATLGEPGDCGVPGGCWQEISDPAGLSATAAGRKVLCGRTLGISLTALLEKLEIEPTRQLLRKGEGAVVRIPLADPASIDDVLAVWGDETIVATEVEKSPIELDHSYAAAGIYRPAFELRSSGTTVGSVSLAPMVVYDPAAGSVSAKGSINSPPGTSRSASAAVLKTEINVRAQYRPGAVTPSGSVVVKLGPGKSRFESTRLEWLVVRGGVGYLAGDGTIDNRGSYRVLVAMLDGEAAGGGSDRVRVRLQDLKTGEVVYDTERGAPDDAPPSTALATGRVKVGG